MVENADYEFPAMILAGGRSRRMGGGDKALLDLGGRTILSRVIARVAPQASTLALNANGDPTRFAGFGLPVIADSVPGFAGPLAGVLVALDWAARLGPAASHVLVVPADTPFLPRDLAARLQAALPTGPDAALAESGGRLHPVIGLWAVAPRAALRQALETEGLRKVEDWIRRLAARSVQFDAWPHDPFFNVNSPEDLAQAARLLAEDSSR